MILVACLHSLLSRFTLTNRNNTIPSNNAPTTADKHSLETNRQIRTFKYLRCQKL